MTPLPNSFDRRLCAESSAPIAVAFSGGGDSLMALKLTKAWADRHQRPVIALSVDHGLQTASRAWIDAAHASAERLGAGFRALAWTGDKPQGGLPAAARAARHGLLADAARHAGARVVVFGHTADDMIEADLMRAAGLRMGAMREWSPSPVWPQGRSLFLLRPLLGLRRAAIRAALAAENESWIDDPANEDPRSPRARMRPEAGRSPSPADPGPGDDADLAFLAQQSAVDAYGAIRIPRTALRSAPRSRAHRLVAAALTCAGGSEKPPRSPAIEALCARLAGATPFAATLGGSKINAGEDVLIVRDAGEFKRVNLGPLQISARSTIVWDGRFEITAGDAPAIVRPMVGRMKILPFNDLEMIKRLDPIVRSSLPSVDQGETKAFCPILAGPNEACAKSLIEQRFFSACGVYSNEGAT